MKKARKILAALLAGTMVFGLTACGAQKEAADTQSNEAAVTMENTGDADTDTESTADANTAASDLKTFRIGCGDAVSGKLFDLAGVAQTKGYLEEELNKVGYTLEVIGFAGAGPEVNTAIMSGSIDAASYGDFPSFTSKGTGADTTIVAVTNSKLTYDILVASEDIQTPADLEGKKVVVQQGTSVQYAWEHLVDALGIDAEKVEIVNASVTDGMSLLQTGDADALVSSSYFIVYLESLGVGHVLEGVDATAGYTTAIISFSNPFLKENPEVAVAVNKALIRAYEDITAEPQELYDVLGERYGADVIEASYGFDPGLSYLTPELTEEVRVHYKDLYDWMNQNSLLQGEIDLDTYLDSSYYETAAEELAAE